MQMGLVIPSGNVPGSRCEYCRPVDDDNYTGSVPERLKIRRFKLHFKTVAVIITHNTECIYKKKWALSEGGAISRALYQGTTT
jgi:hypothetical protein